MPDKMHFSLGPIDQCDRLHRLVGQCEDMLAGPRPDLSVAIVLRRDQSVIVAEHIAQLVPLPCVRARAMQRYD